tara:strand:+ start:39754 stop:40506 length:753 start_codon:yes stop_codon:yes gene_type:complete
MSNTPEQNELEKEINALRTADYADLKTNIFDRLDEIRDKLGLESNSAAAMNWMKGAINSLYDLTEISVEESFLAKDSHRGQLIAPRAYKRVGEMFLFNYMPATKNRNEMGFWDTFPLIYIVKFRPDGFEGINLHYLPTNLREHLFLNLLRLTTNQTDEGLELDQNNVSQTARLKLSYELLNKSERFRYFRPCYRRYKYNRIESKMLRVAPKYWAMAMYLPFYRFRKATKIQVWDETRKEIIKDRQRRRFL